MRNAFVFAVFLTASDCLATTMRRQFARNDILPSLNIRDSFVVGFAGKKAALFCAAFCLLCLIVKRFL